jgi:uncharacterized protein YdaL
MRRLAVLLLLALACLPCVAADKLRVCLYFDGAENEAGFTMGERSAVMVGNLLGHFREVQLASAPSARYTAGSLARCDRLMYLGAYFDAKLPDAFLADIAAFQGPVLWMNYNIWQLARHVGAERFREQWGFDYERVEPAPPTGDAVPAFFSEFRYKGASFRKPIERNAEGTIIWQPELVIVRNTSAQVLADARHTGTGQRAPYVLRKGDLFYVADNPVSVIDERDRYLIFADLLFDFLKLPPRSEHRYALARIEDVHPAYDLKLLYLTIEVFKRRKLPFAITLIPRYIGPEPVKPVDATENRAFVKMIQYAVANGASILVHGYEHQIPVDLGCGVSFSGEGYEFWDVCNNRPLPFESEAYFQDRIGRAKQILNEANIPYVGWVTPHYAASPLGMKVIERNFDRVLQQKRYYLRGRTDPAGVIDQFFPYTIVRDNHGVHVWPENLGYVPLPSAGGSRVAVEDMIEAARLNRVVRDGWASFFWHPAHIRTELGIASLERLVDGIRAEGYEFVSLGELRKRGE